MVAGWTLVCVGQMLSYTERANCTKTKVKYEVKSIEKFLQIRQWIWFLCLRYGFFMISVDRISIV